jgi:2-amino-4-hydroxy-6-hydroxymethyldihydropteridine diphosphokinase
MALVYLSLGSNIDRYRHITAALDALSAAHGALAISPVYESESVGFNGSHFLNLVVAIHTDVSVGELCRELKALEARNGRVKGAPKFSPRTLDVDILTFGDCTGVVDNIELPRAEILENAFVLRPLADLAPDEHHPVVGKTYAQLWREYQRDQKLWPVAFRWQGELISVPPR